MFKNLTAKSCRFNLRKSMERLRVKLGGLDMKEVNAGNEIRSVLIDMNLLMDNWNPETYGLPPKEIIDDFNSYLFSGEYGINHIKVLAYAASYLEDKHLDDFSTLLFYYHEILSGREESILKSRAIVMFFVEVMIEGFNHKMSKCSNAFANAFIEVQSSNWNIKG